MTIPLVSPLFHLLTDFLGQALSSITSLSIVFAILHRLGLVQRAIHRIAERQVSVLLLNGAPVTASKVEIDWIRGKAWATDVIIHSPDRDKWKWDSPLIVRFGKVHMHASFVSLLDPVSQIMGYLWRDIYKVEVEDVQVFVEKRRNVYNFHLLDESLDIPDPIEIISSMNLLDQQGAGQQQHQQDSAPPSPSSSPSQQQQAKGLEMIVSGDAEEDSETAGGGSVATFSPSLVGEDSFLSDDIDLPGGGGAVSFESASSFAGESDAAEKKANEIVTTMLKTVSKLGKAANEGGKEGLERAFKNQRDGFVSKLKQFQEQRTIDGASGGGGSSGGAGAGSSSGGIGGSSLSRSGEHSSNSSQLLVAPRKKKSSVVPGTPPTNNSNSASNERQLKSLEWARESMQVMKQMGKAMEKNVAEIQQSFKPPEKKKDHVEKEEPPLRVGYIVFRDCRIFTKDVILSSSGAAQAMGGGGGAATGGGGSHGNVVSGLAVATGGGNNSPDRTNAAGGAGKTNSSNSRQRRTATAAAAKKWSKPILLKEVAFNSMELCPSSGGRDEDGMPLIGVNPDKLLDIMLKRALAEMAKTNTGRLLNNAFGEVLNWMDGKGSSAGMP